jgi:hypothetical protein
MPQDHGAFTLPQPDECLWFVVHVDSVAVDPGHDVLGPVTGPS